MAKTRRANLTKWRIYDPFIIYFVSLLVAGFVGLIDFSSETQTVDSVPVLALVGAVQWIVAWLIISELAQRRGFDTWYEGCYFRLEKKDWIWLPIGIGAQLLSQLLSWPLEILAKQREFQDVTQDTVAILRGAPLIWQLALAVLFVFVGPIGEEIVFRGILLTSLRKRFNDGNALIVSAALFAVVHIPVGAVLVSMPFLFGLGILLGWRMLATRSVAQPIAIHIGYNLIAVIYTIYQSATA